MVGMKYARPPSDIYGTKLCPGSLAFASLCDWLCDNLKCARPTSDKYVLFCPRSSFRYTKLRPVRWRLHLFTIGFVG